VEAAKEIVHENFCFGETVALGAGSSSGADQAQCICGKAELVEALAAFDNAEAGQ
jgi:hypothetical protein